MDTGKTRKRLTLRRAHKWAGIVAALWLAILGLTGFLLDHRDWRWMWSVSVPDTLFTAEAVGKKNGADISIYRLNPRGPEFRAAAGRRGAWWSRDGGAAWNRSVFPESDGATPQALAAVDDVEDGSWRVWLGTDDGVWVSHDNGAIFTRVALAGRFINALTEGAAPGQLIGVADRSAVFTLDTARGAVEWRRLDPLAAGLAPAVNLSRFTHDLHFGRGLVAGIGSLLVNDAGGALFVALPLTGVLFWALPLAWKRRGARDKAGHAAQRATMRWLHLSHAAFMGILALIPVTYLSLTGILLDHREELNDWMRSIQIPRGLLPPVYGMGGWEGEIYSALGYPGEPGKFSLGTRSGLFTTDNGDANWRREPLPGPPACFVWSLRRLGGAALAGGMGCPNYALENGAWRPVKGVGHMPSDVAALPAGRVWKSHAGFILETPGGMKKLDWPLPAAEGMPLFALVDGLHSGLIFHPRWKWVNDAVAALALVLTGTGLVRLWRKRWSVARGLAWREAEEPPLTPVEAAHG